MPFWIYIMVDDLETQTIEVSSYDITFRKWCVVKGYHQYGA